MKNDSNSFMELELKGTINIVERNKKTRRVISRDNIDGELVLKLLLQAIRDGVEILERKRKSDDV